MAAEEHRQFTCSSRIALMKCVKSLLLFRGNSSNCYALLLNKSCSQGACLLQNSSSGCFDYVCWSFTVIFSSHSLSLHLWRHCRSLQSDKETQVISERVRNRLRCIARLMTVWPLPKSLLFVTVFSDEAVRTWAVICSFRGFFEECFENKNVTKVEWLLAAKIIKTDWWMWKTLVEYSQIWIWKWSAHFSMPS